MSERPLTESEVLTGHTDVICSTSIERIVSGRNAALAEIEVLIRRLAAISEQAASIGGGTSNNRGQITSHRHGCWLVESEELAMKIITQNIDRSIWRNLMHQSGLGGLMGTDSLARCYRKLALEEVCAVSEENIHRTFKMWLNDKEK